MIKFFGKVRRRYLWECRCLCGVVKNVRSDALKCGDSVSCGCHKLSIFKKLITKHGLSRCRNYRRWQAIIDRCIKKNSQNYHYYGDRGIKVCSRWLKFENFLKDMGSPPTPRHTIERIDNDGNYEPKNCKWGTMKEQGNNRRNSRIINHLGMSMTVSQWGDYLGISAGLIFSRLQIGWSNERALTIEIRGGR